MKETEEENIGIKSMRHDLVPRRRRSSRRGFIRVRVLGLGPHSSYLRGEGVVTGKWSGGEVGCTRIVSVSTLSTGDSPSSVRVVTGSRASRLGPELLLFCQDNRLNLGILLVEIQTLHSGGVFFSRPPKKC